MTLVLEQLDRRLRVLADVGRLLDDLTAAPMELELAGDLPATAAGMEELTKSVKSSWVQVSVGSLACFAWTMSLL